jgi:hypothetical protein
VTNGVTPIVSGGASAAIADVKALIKAFTTANPNWSRAWMLMSPANFSALNMARAVESPTVFSIPVLTSAALGTNVVMLDPSAILFGDDNGFSIDIARHASLQMDSAPMNPPDATVAMKSLWQMNCVGLRAEWMVSWKKARAGAVQYVSGADWTGP